MWCDTWRDQLPRLQDSERALDGLPVDFLMVSVDGRWPELLPSKDVMLLDRGAQWSRPLGIDHVPTTLVVDSSGTVRFEKVGVMRMSQLTQELRSLLLSHPQK